MIYMQKRGSRDQLFIWFTCEIALAVLCSVGYIKLRLLENHPTHSGLFAHRLYKDSKKSLLPADTLLWVLYFDNNIDLAHL